MIAGLTQTQAAADHGVSSAGTIPNSPELATVLFSLSSDNGNRLAVGAAGALLYGALLLYTSAFPQILPSEFPDRGLCHLLRSPSLPPPVS